MGGQVPRFSPVEPPLIACGCRFSFHPVRHPEGLHRDRRLSEIKCEGSYDLGIGPTYDNCHSKLGKILKCVITTRAD